MKLLKIQVAIMLFMVFVLPGLGYSQRTGNCPDNMTSYWLFDEQGGMVFPDSVGGLDAGCAGDSCPAPVPGKIANAVSFDGINDGNYIVVVILPP